MVIITLRINALLHAASANERACSWEENGVRVYSGKGSDVINLSLSRGAGRELSSLTDLISLFTYLIIHSTYRLIFNSA